MCPQRRNIHSETGIRFKIVSQWDNLTLRGHFVWRCLFTHTRQNKAIAQARREHNNDNRISQRVGIVRLKKVRGEGIKSFHSHDCFLMYLWEEEERGEKKWSLVLTHAMQRSLPTYRNPWEPPRSRGRSALDCSCQGNRETRPPLPVQSIGHRTVLRGETKQVKESPAPAKDLLNPNCIICHATWQ